MAGFTPAFSGLLMLGAIVAASCGAWAQNAQTQPQTSRFDDWELVCAPAQNTTKPDPASPGAATKGCRLQQAQAVNGGKDVVFLFNIVVEKKQAAAIISTPLNVYLPAGLDLKVDNGPVRKAMFETCNVSGCHAGFVLTDAVWSSLRRGRELTVTVRDTKATQIPIKVSLKGIAAGVNALKAASK